MGRCRHSLRSLAREGDDVARFGVVKADRLDVLAQFSLRPISASLRRVGALEQFLGRFVDALVGRLRRQHHGDDEREGLV